MLEIWNGVHGSKGFAGATTGRTEGPLSSLSISAHSCPVEHLIWELFSVIYSQINFFFVCPFLHHFHKLQSKCCNFPLVLGYWNERMGKWPYAQLEIQRNATAAGDSEWGAGNWSDASEREGHKVSFGHSCSAAQRKCRGFSGGAGSRRHQNMFSSLLLESLNETQWSSSNRCSLKALCQHPKNQNDREVSPPEGWDLPEWPWSRWAASDNWFCSMVGEQCPLSGGALGTGCHLILMNCGWVWAGAGALTLGWSDIGLWQLNQEG